MQCVELYIPHLSSLLPNSSFLFFLPIAINAAVDVSISIESLYLSPVLRVADAGTVRR